MYAGRDDRQVECACGLAATRRPFSGLPFLKGETMPQQIPESAYREEAKKRQFNSTWGTAERSMEMLRASTKTKVAETTADKTGFRHVDQQKMEELSW